MILLSIIIFTFLYFLGDRVLTYLVALYIDAFRWKFDYHLTKIADLRLEPLDKHSRDDYLKRNRKKYLTGNTGPR